MSRCSLKLTVNPSKVKVLMSPIDFYHQLISMYQKTEKRAVISTLYIGCGKFSSTVMKTLSTRLEDSIGKLQIDILMDKQRASRPEGSKKEPMSSLTQCLPLLKHSSENVRISLFHNPLLGRWLHEFLPSRMNELLGVMHIKAFISDDTTVLSGANLSDSYLFDRQDRYIVIQDENFSNIIHEIIRSVQYTSFTLQSDFTMLWENHFPNPILNPSSFKKYFSSYIKERFEFLRKYYNLSSSNLTYFSKLTVNQKALYDLSCYESINNFNITDKMQEQYEQDKESTIQSKEKFCSKPFCLVHICMQAGFSDPPIIDELLMISNLLKISTLLLQPLVLASGYLNLPKEYLNSLKKKYFQISVPYIENRNVDEFYNEPFSNTTSSHQIIKNSHSDSFLDKHNKQISPFEVSKDPNIKATFNSQINNDQNSFLKRHPITKNTSSDFNLQDDSSIKISENLNKINCIKNNSLEQESIRKNNINNNSKLFLFTAAPSANSFYLSKGLSYYIPGAYACMAEQNFSFITNNSKDSFCLFEFNKDDWTFHSKGIWLYDKNDFFQSKSNQQMDITLNNLKFTEKESILHNFECSNKENNMIGDSLNKDLLNKKSTICNQEPTHEINNQFNDNIISDKSNNIKSIFLNNSENSNKDIVKNIEKNNNTNSELQLKENYYNPNFISDNSNENLFSPDVLPILTVLGSSNYGERATWRDLEMSYCIETNDIDLQIAWQTEVNNMFKYSKTVSPSELRSRYPFWLRWIVMLFGRWYL